MNKRQRNTQQPITMVHSVAGVFLVSLALMFSNASAFSATTARFSNQRTTELGYQIGSDVMPMEVESRQPESKQAVVDDYLEFLDRRYNRLHEGEHTRPAQPRFSVLKWLTQGADEEASNTHGKLSQAHSDTDNALHVLGLAGLASEKLLKKHHIPVSPATMPTGATSSSSYHQSGGRIASALRPIAAQRQKLMHFQAAKVQALAKTMLKLIKKGPAVAAKQLVGLAGGKRTVAVTLTLASAVLFLVVRPLAQTIVSEGAHHA